MSKARVERENTRVVNGHKVYDAKFIDLDTQEYVSHTLAVLRREGEIQTSTPTDDFVVERFSATEYVVTFTGNDGDAESDAVGTFDRLWKAKAEIARLVLANGETYPVDETAINRLEDDGCPNDDDAPDLLQELGDSWRQ